MTAQHIVVSLHVLAAVVIMGPLVFVTSATPRAMRSGDAKTLGFLTSSTRVYAIVSLLVPVLGLGAVHSKYDIHFSQTWIWLSLVLYVVALGLFTGLVGSAQKKALALIEKGESAAAQIGAIAAGSGIGALLIGVIAFLMIFQPGRPGGAS